MEIHGTARQEAAIVKHIKRYSRIRQDEQEKKGYVNMKTLHVVGVALSMATLAVADGGNQITDVEVKHVWKSSSTKTNAPTVVTTFGTFGTPSAKQAKPKSETPTASTSTGVVFNAGCLVIVNGEHTQWRGPQKLTKMPDGTWRDVPEEPVVWLFKKFPQGKKEYYTKAGAREQGAFIKQKDGTFKKVADVPADTDFQAILKMFGRD